MFDGQAVVFYNYEYSTGWQLCAGGVFYGLVIVCLRLFYGQAVVGL